MQPPTMSFLGVGAPEAILVGIVALVVFGPKGLAEVSCGSIRATLCTVSIQGATHATRDGFITTHGHCLRPPRAWVPPLKPFSLPFVK